MDTDNNFYDNYNTGNKKWTFIGAYQGGDDELDILLTSALKGYASDDSDSGVSGGNDHTREDVKQPVQVQSNVKFSTVRDFVQDYVKQISL